MIINVLCEGSTGNIVGKGLSFKAYILRLKLNWCGINLYRNLFIIGFFCWGLVGGGGGVDG